MMEILPEELCWEILSYLPDVISAREVCFNWKQLIESRTTKIKRQLSKQSTEAIKNLIYVLDQFTNLKRIQLIVMYDHNLSDKFLFFAYFIDKLTELTLKEISFCNRFFEMESNLLSGLKSLTLDECDLSSSSHIFANFVVSLPSLKNLTMSCCSGIYLDSLNYIGSLLGNTCIKHFTFSPTYSYYNILKYDQQHDWNFENLESFVIRSKLVVIMKKCVMNILGTSSKNLKVLELIGEIDLGENITQKIIDNYPNLEVLALGKGCSKVQNNDFNRICNNYENMKQLEFHFTEEDEMNKFTIEKKERQIKTLILGLTKDISIQDLGLYFPNVRELKVILYFKPQSNKDFVDNIIKNLPQIEVLEYQVPGKKMIKFLNQVKSTEAIFDLNPVNNTLTIVPTN